MSQTLYFAYALTYTRDVFVTTYPMMRVSGVAWEANLIRNLQYEKKSQEGNIFINVQFDEHNPDAIPLPMRGNTVFVINGLTFDDGGYESLYRHVTGQPKTKAPEIGKRQALPVERQKRSWQDLKNETIPPEDIAGVPKAMAVTDTAVIRTETSDPSEQKRLECEALRNAIHFLRMAMAEYSTPLLKMKEHEEKIAMYHSQSRQAGCDETANFGENTMSNKESELCVSLGRNWSESRRSFLKRVLLMN